MKHLVFGRVLCPFLVVFAVATPLRAADARADLAKKALAVLNTHCHRCHGQDGAVEGGMNYVLDREKLVLRKKIVPGQPDQSPIFKKVAAGKMPPPGEQPRPSPDEVALLREWIAAGAGTSGVNPEARPYLTEAAVFDLILADLEKTEKRARRFARYFSLVPLANAGAGPDELATYRRALAKLINSLSWHPRIGVPKPIDPAGLILRIDLRDYLWDANLWNRLLADYPYGILYDSAVARAVMINSASRMPLVRLDWFVANASRAPLYYDLLQLPSNLSELERQLRVDPVLNIQQERVARAGFIGSGISRNNRVLERHDAMNGAYWRTYDFDAIPQNLIDRDTLLPDRRNLFAYPLGPGLGENGFLHAGGEAIFALPNGLHGYMLMNAANVRLDKGPIAIVSDPKRPDRSVEAGVSCMGCHISGILQKDDQIRDHVSKNAKAFSRTDGDIVKALYAPKEKMRKLMEEDGERYKKAIEKTGARLSAYEVVMTMTLRYEADVDLPTLAAEVGVKPDDLLPRLTKTDSLARNLGALKVPGATVARQAVVQAFGDLVRELRLGGVYLAGSTGQQLPDATGEIDPLESQSSPANAVAFSPDGRLVAFASADKSVVIWDVDAGREVRRCIGHTASVWCVAFSPDGARLLSGGKDATVRLWDVETARELRKFDGHGDLVTSVAFSPDGRRALSAGFDHEAILWDLERGGRVSGFTFVGRDSNPDTNRQDRNPDPQVKYLHHVAFSPDGKRCLICGDRTIFLADASTGKVIRTFAGHTASVVTAMFSADGKRILSGSDDGTLRLWDAEKGTEIRSFTGHEAGVKSVGLSADGKSALSGSSDTTVRLWDVETGQVLKAFRKHAEPVAGVTFINGQATLSVSRDAAVKLWQLAKVTPPPPDPVTTPNPVGHDLRPLATIAVGGTVGSMHLSADEKYLYYLNLTESKLARVVAATGQRDKVLRLADGTDALALSRDGKTVAAIATVADRRGAPGRLQIVDALTMKPKDSFALSSAAYDVAVSDAGLVFLSGGGSDWTDVAVFDVGKGEVVARWGGIWARSFVQLSADQKRLYASSQGVNPANLDAVPLPAKLDEKPTSYRAAVPSQHPLGGDFQVTPDGRYLLFKTGTVLKASPNRDEDLRFHAAVGPFGAAAVSPEARAALLFTRDGALKVYSYPEFKPLATHQIGIVATQAVCASKHGRLYVAGIDPRTVGETPRAKGVGDLFVFELKDVLGTGAAATKP
jgi:WD40 repeat protein/mono/diheme cytochrome c family protein